MVGVMDNKNSFGNQFTDVAERLKIEVNHDNFLANIILMKKEHLSQFLREIGKCWSLYSFLEILSDNNLKGEKRYLIFN